MSTMSSFFDFETETVRRELSVFGGFHEQPAISATIIFVAVLLIITIFESILEHFEQWSKKANLEMLFKKLYREFFMMGLISFALFILRETVQLDSSEYFHAFELAHIVVVFIGLSFVVQACFFVYYIRKRTKNLEFFNSVPGSVLLLKYIDIHKVGHMVPLSSSNPQLSLSNILSATPPLLHSFTFFHRLPASTSTISFHRQLSSTLSTNLHQRP